MERERKPEIAVNLVRKSNEEYYRIVDDQEMFLLKARGNVHFEKARFDKGRVGSFYVEM
ncbi:hypothetical protein SEA_BILLNYE_91 [Streptomyces phage BillNye]|uniref:Uncharacterized protein n=2 Tax=Wilnyevirus billnye TaxID=2560486 RepID=A0A2L1IVU1_9CAUD|nr:hypothetical protein FDJ30_gp147 [Streptomyces phage BillNye]AVD99286.1 hypothetical protein SEA_BILLNYE_91 [Streptomyces phage BillNye]QBZ72369.1 hypothetical protein SEA_CIRCINUS_92 [Streptomyces phage Circinus]